MNEVSPPMEGAPLITPSSTDHPLYNSIVEACRTVFDPEIPVNIYDLGLIYTIEITEDNDVSIIMSLTAPGCPVAGENARMGGRCNQWNRWSKTSICRYYLGATVGNGYDE